MKNDFSENEKDFFRKCNQDNPNHHSNDNPVRKIFEIIYLIIILIVSLPILYAFVSICFDDKISIYVKAFFVGGVGIVITLATLRVHLLRQGKITYDPEKTNKILMYCGLIATISAMVRACDHLMK